MSKTTQKAKPTDAEVKKAKAQLENLLPKIERAASLAAKSMSETLREHRKVGELLVEARRLSEIIAPKQWGAYCLEHCHMTQQHAGRLMALVPEDAWAKVEKAEGKAKKHGPLTLVQAVRAARGLPVYTVPGKGGRAKTPKIKRDEVQAAIGRATIERPTLKISLTGLCEVLKQLGWEVI